MLSPETVEVKERCKDVLTRVKPGSRDNDQLQVIISYLKLANILPPKMDDVKILMKLCQGMQMLLLEPNTLLFLQGQPATSYFIIFSGAVDIRQTKDPVTIKANQSTYSNLVLQSLGPDFSREALGDHLVRLTENKGFGEEALIKNVPRAASALSMWKTEMIEIEPQLYHDTLKSFHAAQGRVAETFEVLRTHMLCEGLRDRIITEIAYEMQIVLFSAQQVIGTKKHPIENVIVIKTGQVSEVKVKNGIQKEVCKRGQGFLLGAVDLIHGRTHYHHTYIAVSPVQAFRLPLKHFAILKNNKAAALKLVELERVRHKAVPAQKSAKELLTALASQKDLMSAPTHVDEIPDILSTAKRHSAIHFLLAPSRNNRKHIPVPCTSNSLQKAAFEAYSSIEDKQHFKPPPRLNAKPAVLFPLTNQHSMQLSGSLGAQIINTTASKNIGQAQEKVDKKDQLCSQLDALDANVTNGPVSSTLLHQKHLEHKPNVSFAELNSIDHLPQDHNTHILLKSQSAQQLHLHPIPQEELTKNDPISDDCLRTSKSTPNLKDPIAIMGCARIFKPLKLEKLACLKNNNVHSMEGHLHSRLSAEKILQFGETKKILADTLPKRLYNELCGNVKTDASISGLNAACLPNNEHPHTVLGKNGHAGFPLPQEQVLKEALPRVIARNTRTLGLSYRSTN